MPRYVTARSTRTKRGLAFQVRRGEALDIRQAAGFVKFPQAQSADQGESGDIHGVFEYVAVLRLELQSNFQGTALEPLAQLPAGA